MTDKSKIKKGKLGEESISRAIDREVELC